MENSFHIFLILGALAIGAMTPGPSFVLVARIAVGTSRNAGIAASIGMGLGGALFCVLALFGLHTVFATVPKFYFLLKFLGGLYLLFLAFRIIQSANQPLSTTINSSTSSPKMGKSLLIGFTTQISNPKAAIVYGSIFAALLPVNTPVVTYYVLPPLVFLLEAGWYLVVTFVLSSASPRAIYLRSKTLIDRTAGSIMACLGGKLIFNANQ